MKIYYALSIVAALAISTMVGTSLVAAGTTADSRAEVVSVESAALERLKAESDASNTTWRRPL